MRTSEPASATVCFPPQSAKSIAAASLANAIEACERLPEERAKWIEVQLLYTPKSQIVQNSFIFLSVSNSSLPVQIEGDSIHSSKENPYLHGYGIPNVLDVLKKYHAEHVLTYQDGQFVFSIEWPDEQQSCK